MADPFLSEIRIMAFDYPPRGWALANGQLLPINQNQALFSLLGTTYGGNGQTTFALPDLRARVPMHVGSGHVLGESAGAQSHTLAVTDLPSHTHAAEGTTTNADSPIPAGNYLGAANNLYTPPADLTSLHPSSVSNVGGSQAHENKQPYLVVSFCIALLGIFPSHS